MNSSTADLVDAPTHYAGDGEIDCMRAARSMVTGWAMWFKIVPYRLTVAEMAKYMMAFIWLFQAFRYVWRAPLKNGLQDLKKARRCIDYAIGEWEK